MTGRRDTKNRVLRPGEYQKSNGKYEYRYADASGNIRSVSSWRLVATDRLPQGRKSTEPLRDMEARIAKDVAAGIEANAHSDTLNKRFDNYMDFREDIVSRTRISYKLVYDKFCRNTIGLCEITSIKFSDIINLYDNIIAQGRGVTGLEEIQNFLHPVFDIAIKDGIIRINPTDGALKEIRRRHPKKSKKKQALTIEQQESMVAFASKSPIYSKWMPLITFLLGTGCRIGEALGITWNDCDFEREEISIDHTLLYKKTKLDGGYRFAISTPKTDAGTRVIPMVPEVKDMLLREKKRQDVCGYTTSVVDGVSGFIFHGQSRTVLTTPQVDLVLYNIVRAHNKAVDRGGEGAPTIYLPRISAHIMRHTFCTRLCEQGVNIKVIQEVMGHSDIRVTLEIYTDVSKRLKRASFNGLRGKLGLLCDTTSDQKPDQVSDQKPSTLPVTI